MYTVQITTPPSTEPVTVDELKAQLRLNDDSEDTLLAEYIQIAREFFEAYTMRAVHPTTFRQYLDRLETDINLMRSQVRSVVSVKYYDTNGTLQTLSTNDYTTDTVSCPGTVTIHNLPAVSSTKSPVAYVEFSAGWDTDKVPKMVKSAIRLLAAHFYQHREAHTENPIEALPFGFRAVCDQYMTGTFGPWTGGDC